MRHLVTFLFFLIAVVFYSLGAAGPGTLFLILGAVAEGMFWYRIIGRRKTSKNGPEKEHPL